jgi:hypothetical protein
VNKYQDELFHVAVDLRFNDTATMHLTEVNGMNAPVDVMEIIGTPFAFYN